MMKRKNGQGNDQGSGRGEAGCAVEVTLGLIDGNWKGVILFHLQEGLLRFGELRRKMPGITQRMLTKQLRALEEDGLITRTVYPEVPPRVEYALS
ncbi:winged helix-turn-helix transcriptional regulator, partial [Afipia felis]|uniref:winged helix-turn-helix transcriptional regulator n=1 Tax=Afipia felis TaxID=1035 RepID=UPI001FCD03A8